MNWIVCIVVVFAFCDFSIETEPNDVKRPKEIWGVARISRYFLKISSHKVEYRQFKFWATILLNYSFVQLNHISGTANAPFYLESNRHVPEQQKDWLSDQFNDIKWFVWNLHISSGISVKFHEKYPLKLYDVVMMIPKRWWCIFSVIGH